MIVIALNERGWPIGETHWNAHISNAQVDRIRELHEDERVTPGQIAIRLNISVNTIRKICRYERRAQTPERWKTVRG
jgi:hypothetical protein